MFYKEIRILITRKCETKVRNPFLVKVRNNPLSPITQSRLKGTRIINVKGLKHSGKRDQRGIIFFEESRITLSP
jgi:hypothetical protein